MIKYLDKPKGIYFIRVKGNKDLPRHWAILKELKIELSNGEIITIPKDYIFDGASVPKLLWWLFPPIDSGVMGDLIHDRLWENKKQQLEKYNYNSYKARKFADAERMRWRKGHAKNKVSFNIISNLVIRLIGGFYYSKQLNIPT